MAIEKKIEMASAHFWHVSAISMAIANIAKNKCSAHNKHTYASCSIALLAKGQQLVTRRAQDDLEVVQHAA